MTLLSRIADFLSLSTIQPTEARVVTEDSIEDFYQRIAGGRTSPWR